MAQAVTTSATGDTGRLNQAGKKESARAKMEPRGGSDLKLWASFPGTDSPLKNYGSSSNLLSRARSGFSP